MRTEIHQLSELMNEMDEKELSFLLNDFKCSRNKDSEYFLKKMAKKHEKKDISRTYLVIDPDEDTIMGYYTLALKCLSFDGQDVDPGLAEQMNLKDNVAQAYLIGQLARSDEAKKGSGGVMIDEAIKTFIGGKKKFGCRMVRLDCRDELIDYYRSNEFQLIGKNFKKDLNQMATFI
ncbi:MAG: hypothetical protein FWD37_06270 [Methanomassiliicoccaceae archaeon]|nr:hypothetical protein [Methanomassiliicoccaceae archaeon]